MSKTESPERQKDPRAVAIGLRIREARNRKGYSQAGLARNVSLTASAFAQYETGRAMPKIKNLEAIAAKLGVSKEWLMAGDDPSEIQRAHSEAEQRALTAFRNIPLQQQDAALALLEALNALFPKNNPMN